MDRAFRSDCLEFGDKLVARITTQRAHIDQQIMELQALRAELDELEQHTRHGLEACRPGQKVAACAFCPIIDGEGGEPCDC